MSEEIREYVGGEKITVTSTLVYDQATSWAMDREVL
jgi:hypothetical protein